MALLILPVGALLGWLVRPPARAAWATGAIGVVALVVLGILAWSDVEVSPLETLVLVVCTPLSALMAFKIAQGRTSRRDQTG